MGKRPLLYYITDRSAFPGNELERRLRLLHKITEAAKAGVDYIQLRVYYCGDFPWEMRMKC